MEGQVTNTNPNSEWLTNFVAWLSQAFYSYPRSDMARGKIPTLYAMLLMFARTEEECEQLLEAIEPDQRLPKLERAQVLEQWKLLPLKATVPPNELLIEAINRLLRLSETFSAIRLYSSLVSGARPTSELLLGGIGLEGGWLSMFTSEQGSSVLWGTAVQVSLLRDSAGLLIAMISPREDGVTCEFIEKLRAATDGSFSKGGISVLFELTEAELGLDLASLIANPTKRYVPQGGHGSGNYYYHYYGMSPELRAAAGKALLRVLQLRGYEVISSR